MKIAILLLIAAVITSYEVSCVGLTEVFSWRQIEYDYGANGREGGSRIDGIIVFPGATNKVNRGNVINKKQPDVEYIPYNNVPMGATHHKGRLFITMPRRRRGIPSTLNYIDMKSNAGIQSPRLRAYPNLEVNTLNRNFRADSSRIVSVYRTRVDACNRLWFVDTGMLEYPDNRLQVQQPSIWIIDLVSDEVINRFEIPENIVRNGNGLPGITLDVEATNCGDAYAYIPDLVNRALYVYSLKSNHIWAFQHNFFSYDPLQGDFFIGGQRFQWDDGIFSITISNIKRDGFRTAYFHAMASNSEFTVSTRVLRNETAASRDYHGNDFQLAGHRGELSQSTMHEFHKGTGILFYDEISTNSVGCFNSHNDITPENHGLIHRDDQKMIYPSDLMIDTEDIIWVMSNTMPRFIYSNLNVNEFNFRVWKASVKDAITNTPCAYKI